MRFEVSRVEAFFRKGADSLDTQISFSISQLVGWVLGVCGGISVIAGAVVWIVKGVKAMRAPGRAMDDRLETIEKRLSKHDSFLESDKLRLKALEDGNRVTQKALLALLAHGIDGNDVEQMRKAKQELQNYLIER